jgi:hypothetical protein
MQETHELDMQNRKWSSGKAYNPSGWREEVQGCPEKIFRPSIRIDLKHQIN